MHIEPRLCISVLICGPVHWHREVMSVTYRREQLACCLLSLQKQHLLMRMVRLFLGAGPT
jgi:hypothetical protein